MKASWWKCSAIKENFWDWDIIRKEVLRCVCFLFCVRYPITLSGKQKSPMHGFTGNYIKVKHVFDPALANRIVPVILDKPDDDMTFII